MPPVKTALFRVELPAERRPLPEPLPTVESKPGFKFRGAKGWFWTPEQYLQEVPVLGKYKMNFLMNCYRSVFSTALDQSWKNEWRKPLPEAQKVAYANVFRACRDRGINFCFAAHPPLDSPRPLNPNSAEDIGQFYQHYAWAQSQGVHWFSVCLDNESWGNQGPGRGGAEQAKLVNTIFDRLRAKDSEAQLIFCPVSHSGDGMPPNDRAYLEALGRDLHPELYVFWTGDGALTSRNTSQAAASYKSVVKHRLFLWDNYPLDESDSTLQLGPITGRDAALGEVVDGYMSNPLCLQNQLNRIPLLTCADYAYNPKAYDPLRSIGQAIVHLAESPEQQSVLRDLVEVYPGRLLFGSGTGGNPAKERLAWLASSSFLAGHYVQSLEDLSERLAKAFPDRYDDAKKTLRENIASLRTQPILSERSFVELPKEIRPLPEPLSPGDSSPGFKFRGAKGWSWTPEQYLEEIPVLARYKMNFLMNCYSSLFSSPIPGAWTNEWWKPLPETTKQAYAKVIRSCRDCGIIFCFAMHPQYASPRPLNPTSDDDFNHLWQHYQWAQSQGVKWFSLSLDDVSWGNKGPSAGGSEHAQLVNRLLGGLRAKDAEAQIVFCPVSYIGVGDRLYMEVLGREMHPDVYVFWTGDDPGLGPRITRKVAQIYRDRAKHRVFLWDNYPVNDAGPALHLGPVAGRDADLCEVVDGYVSNPLCQQNQINRLPLLTGADYAYNPKAYDPQRSVGQAILHLAETEPQRVVLKDLVEAYPGFIALGGGPGSNPVRERFSQLSYAPQPGYFLRQYIIWMKDLAARLDREFPDRFPATKKNVAADIVWLNQELAKTEE